MKSGDLVLWLIIGVAVLGVLLYWIAYARAQRNLSPLERAARENAKAERRAESARRYASLADSTPLPPDVISKIDGLLRGGEKIAAIKALREYRAVGLAEAKARIDTWDLATERARAVGANERSAGASDDLVDRQMAAAARAMVKAQGWEAARDFLVSNHNMDRAGAELYLRNLI